MATLDAETAAQIYELRSLLESAAAEAAAMHAKPEEIQRMANALVAIGAAYAKKDFHGVLMATKDFYQTMFLCSHKHVAWEMVQRLNGRISWLRSLTVLSSGRGASGPLQMLKILEAIRNRDGAAAAVSCRDHIATASKIALQLLAEDTDCKKI